MGLTLLVGLAGPLTIRFGPAFANEPTDFRRDIAPLLERSCLRCHQPGNEKGDVSLATIEDLKADSAYLVPGDPADSYLLDLLIPEVEGKLPQMPRQGDPLTPDEVERIRRWIAEGATWPDQMVLHDRSKADANWWSLQALAEVDVKAVDGISERWASHPIDRLLFATMAEKGLRPSPPADRRDLIRRITYDLTGLPPTRDAVESFLNDSSPDAFERVVDRLLASPHYGERWGRHWLDVVRFGESNGFERNVLIENMWPFRDYVIRSLNDDKPFDRLVLEHLAGDQIGRGDPAIEVGTTFLVCGPYDDVKNQDVIQSAQIRANTIDEMIRATAETFLGFTVGCARCHDHKFDPIPTRDYYAFFATFAGVEHGSRVLASDEAQRSHRRRLDPLRSDRERLIKARAGLQAEIEARGLEHASTLEASWIRPAVDRFGTEETFPPILAKQVRLIAESRDDRPDIRTGYHIDEFEVWSAEAAPRNVALEANGGKAEGQSRVADDFAGAYGPRLTIDGKYNARWLAAEAELTITLSEPMRIDRVVFSSDR